MKFTHQLEPVLHIKEKSEDIRTYDCFQVNLLFMLKPDGIPTLEVLVQLVQNMMKASCDVIEQNNKEPEDGVIA